MPGLQLIYTVKLGKDAVIPMLQRRPWRRKEVQQLVPMSLNSYVAELGLEPSDVTPVFTLLFLSVCTHCSPPSHTGCTWFPAEVPPLPCVPLLLLLGNPSSSWNRTQGRPCLAAADQH